MAVAPTPYRLLRRAGAAIRMRLPDRVDRLTRVLAWLLLISNIVIVGTGGLVRLTGSGLGCPTWPYCTADSLVTTPEMGLHGLIEFGNRMLTGVLVVVALLAFLSVVRLRRTRPELAGLTFAVGVGIIVQAVVGGITVLLHLDPSVVGFHFFLSGVLVVISTVHLVRVYAAPGPRRTAVARSTVVLAYATAAAVAATVVVGILLTGAGPHAGDEVAARNGLDPVLWQHIHSWPAYVTFALTILLVMTSLRAGRDADLRRWTLLLMAVEVAQIGVGLWQARTGLPIVLVNIHMVLAMLLVAAMTAVVLHLRVAASVPAAGTGSATSPELTRAAR